MGMSERKILNKYYPRDFDPSKIYKVKSGHNKLIKVRIMLPFTIKCIKCKTFSYKGTKFNAIKKRIRSYKILNVPIFRFYIKCPICNLTFFFRTNPLDHTYTIECGAKPISYCSLFFNDGVVEKNIASNQIFFDSLLKINRKSY